LPDDADEGEVGWEDEPSHPANPFATMSMTIAA